MAKKMIVLKSSDGETFEVEEAVAMKSQFIMQMINEGYVDVPIQLPKVTGNILAMIIHFCKRHVDSSTSDYDDDLKVFDTKFVQVDQPTLFAIILAANELKIKSLLELACQTVADMMKGKIVDGIGKNDLTPEEEEEICRENAQAFE